MKLLYYNSRYDIESLDLQGSKAVLTNTLYAEGESKGYAYLDDPSVEKNHCVISISTNGKKAMIFDINSSGGVQKNNELLQKKKSYQLADKDILMIGKKRVLVSF